MAVVLLVAVAVAGVAPAVGRPTLSGVEGTWDDPTLTDWWQREFTDGVDPEYTEQIVPLITASLAGYRHVLDLGTGEGQIARCLQAQGSDVTGLDPFDTQIEVAARRSSELSDRPHFARGEASALPFADESFDAVVACLVFEHIDEVDAAIAEVARTLRPGGRFLFLLNHPLLQTPGSGWIDDQILDPPEQYWRIGPYLPEAVTVEQVQRGVFVRFVHRPLSRYVNALIGAGLSLTQMDEPAPPPGFVAQSPAYADADTVPRLLALTCTKLA